MKLRFSIANRRVAQRLAAIDSYEFPSGVRQRVRLKHSGLGAESMALVEAGLQQWFRIVARRPTARLSMPSMLVDDMWHEFMLHTRDYAAFCDAAFGRFLHHEPESAMTPDQAAANRSRLLLVTLRLARQDEDGSPKLPLLFRVDHEVAPDGARRYVADCGGRGQCYSADGVVCLQHLVSVGRPRRGSHSRRGTFYGPSATGCGSGGGSGYDGGSGGGGGGCGGGGGGG
ncbi:MAG: glycine-rich domain-containing protein [Pseudonocardiales bacterium]